MVGVVEGFRWALLGRAEPLDTSVIASAMLIVVVLLITGLRYFRRTQSEMVDLA